MKILLITDQEPNSQHSAIRGIFDRHLRELADVHIVWFSREAKGIECDDRQTTLPWRYRKWAFLWRFRAPLALDAFDVVIVRNLFVVLKGLLGRTRRPYRLGFWESFPHSFRRFHEAERTKQSLLRKRIEYRVRSTCEGRLLSACDFYLPITRTFAESFRPSLRIPTHPLPMGVDGTQLPPLNSPGTAKDGPLRLIYAGAVDGLRGFEVILDALSSSSENLILDLFTASRNATTEAIESGTDPRIRLFKAIPRAKLLERMRDYDVGLALIPNDRLYDVASPTKTMEYYAMGLPALMSPLAEHTRFFDEDSGFFCLLDRTSIMETIERLCRTPRAVLAQMGEAGRKKVIDERSYSCLASELLRFLGQMREARDPAQH